MTAKTVTVTLTQAEARWILSLTAAAAHLTLEARARRTNLAVFGRCCDALAQTADRRRGPGRVVRGRWAGTTWSRGEALIVTETGSVLRNRGFEVMPNGPGASA